LSWETTATEFLNTHSDLTFASFSNVNFNPNDFVNTEQIINFDEEWCPDYLIVTDEDDNILHTWFIIESQRTRLGQYRIVLKRDLINDYYDYLYDAPTFIEKGTVPPTDSAIFNSEGMQFNQIKISENILKDESDIAWIVGYTSRNLPTDSGSDTQLTVNTSLNLEYDNILSSFPLKDYINDPNPIIYTRPNEWKIEFTTYRGTYDNNETTILSHTTFSFNQDVTEYSSNTNNIETSAFPISFNFNDKGRKDLDALFEPVLGENLENIRDGIIEANLFGDITDIINEAELLNYEGNIIYDSDSDKYFKVRLEKTTSVKNETWMANYSNSSLGLTLKNIFTGFDGIGTIGESGPRLNGTSNRYYIIFDEITSANLQSIILKDHFTLNDAPYDMFCIPYGKIKIIEDGNELGTVDRNISLKFAQKLAELLGKDALLDLQLLPYCPIKYAINDENINISGLPSGSQYSLLSTTAENGPAVSILLWCTNSSGTFTIPYSYFVKDYKIENECDIWRICSPNYQGIFEFSAAKNRGINFFKVDYTYKPYNPYIHIAPNWGGLYGEDFNDARGLILGGDFSVATTSDAFRQYEITNKNYQNIFDRGIKNMDTMRKYQAVDETIGAIAGSFQTSATGFMLGGGWGAAIGGVAGLGAGLADVAMSEGKYRENKSYQTDLYNYNLQNVRALPDSLVKSSALTYNNKLFPFIEHYTCTDEEKNALRNKIRYNGMTIMRIEPLGNYLIEGNGSNFIQGQIIKINDNICDDSHLSLAIYEEIKRGVFI